MDFESFLRDSSLTAQVDQQRAGLRQFAIGVYGYYAELVRTGFTEEQAFGLVVEYQRAILTQATLRQVLKEAE